MNRYLDALSHIDPDIQYSPLFISLTTSQTKVALLLISSADIDEIASILSVSRETVKSHIKSIYKKLKIHSRFELKHLLLSSFKKLDLTTQIVIVVLENNRLKRRATPHATPQKVQTPT